MISYLSNKKGYPLVLLTRGHTVFILLSIAALKFSLLKIAFILQ